VCILREIVIFDPNLVVHDVNLKLCNLSVKYIVHTKLKVQSLATYNLGCNE
jgi:hypothetical protein